MLLDCPWLPYFQMNSCVSKMNATISHLNYGEYMVNVWLIPSKTTISHLNLEFYWVLALCATCFCCARCSKRRRTHPKNHPRAAVVVPHGSTMAHWLKSFLAKKWWCLLICFGWFLVCQVGSKIHGQTVDSRRIQRIRCGSVTRPEAKPWTWQSRCSTARSAGNGHWSPASNRFFLEDT